MYTFKPVEGDDEGSRLGSAYNGVNTGSDKNNNGNTEETGVLELD